MLKVKFKNGLNGSLTDWTPYMVVQEVGVLKRSVESENPGEAGLIVYDNLSLSFRYEEGNVVYDAFSSPLSGSSIYVFEIWAIKSDKSEIKIFEGIADFTSLEWNLNERTLKIEIVDKIKALDMLADTESQRGNLIDCISRLNCTDYLTDFIKRSLPGLGVWLEIQTYELINNNGYLERGDPVPHSQTILHKGEIFNHPGEGVGLCFVIDSELMLSMGGWTTTFVKVHPVKACALSLHLPAENTSIVVTGNIFNKDEIVYLENLNQTEFLKILDEGFGSDVSWIYNVERHYTGTVSYDWNEGVTVKLSNQNHTFITDLNSPPSTTHLWYYGNEYYGITDINCFSSDSFGRNVLYAFDGIKILNAIVSRVLFPLELLNRFGRLSFPVSLNYYPKLVDASPFGKHSLEAVKLLADSMHCYIFIDRLGRFVVQKKSKLGDTDSGTERIFDSIRLSQADIPRKFFWDKIVDGVEAKVVSDGYLSGSAQRQTFANVKPRNELNKEIVALDTTVFTEKSLSDFACSAADEYLDFYGRRHDAYSVSIPLYDALLEWELLDNTVINGQQCFFSSFEIDLQGREFNAELISLPGENYYNGQVNIPLSIVKYNQTSSGSDQNGGTAGASQQVIAGAIEYSANEPLQVDSSIISLGYEDNLKLSSNNKLDTVQGIRTTDTPRFSAIAIGGAADSLYKGKFYGDVKVTGKIVVDGDLNISGALNEVNLTELYISDKTINLNKGGTDSTAPDSGLRILGSYGGVNASIIYSAAGNWAFDKSVDIADGNSVKINNIQVLTSNTLGSGIINSSLTKVGTITNGVWNGTPVNAQYINYNSSNFQNSSNQLTSKSISASSGNGMAVTGTFNLGGAIVIDTPQDLRITASPSFNNLTLGNGVLSSNADLTLNITGSSILPQTGFAYNLGSINKKFLSVHAAELCVETLVSQNTKATIGGRILIGESNELVANLSQSDFYIFVKYNNLVPNDIIYLESAGKIEYIKIIYLTSSNPGNYEYQVQRGYDGSASNNWYAGDSLFNTGGAGDGFIDLYSIKGIKGVNQPGPTMTGNVRNSASFNDWSEHWAIGNLNGLYGYTSPAFGVGLGRYGPNSSFVTVDPLNGFAIKHKDSQGTEVKVIELDTEGNGYFRGNITSIANITGGTLQTSYSGKRVLVDGPANNIKFYNDSGDYVSVEGYLSAQNEKRLKINGALIGEGNLYITGDGVFNGPVISTNFINAAYGFKLDGTLIVDEDSNAYFNTISANDISFTNLKIGTSNLLTVRPSAGKILVTDSDRKIISSDVAAGELFTAAFCELYDQSSNSVITCDGSDYVRWTNSSTGIYKGIAGDNTADAILIGGGFAGKYNVSFHVSFLTNSAGDFYWTIKVGSNWMPAARVCINASANTHVNIAGGCLLNLQDGDQVSIGCFGPSGAQVSVIYLNLRIIKCSN